MRIVLVVALLLVGCTKPNPNFCEGPDCPDGPPKTCTVSEGTCVCLTPPGICVQCTNDDEHNCGGTKPQCGDDNRCRACRANDDCDSGACLEDGACASADQIIYAAPAGVDVAGCGQAAGQNECSIKQALLEVAGPRNVIRLAPGMYDVTDLDGLVFDKSATLIARGATLRRTANAGPLLTVRLDQAMKLVGGTLRGPNQDDGIQCNGGKVEVHEATILDMSESGVEGDSCELTVARSTLRVNQRGGINMLGDPKLARITNNFIYLNGALISTIGGMVVKVAPGSKVEFNTVVDNLISSAGGAGGIQCDGTYDAPSNLVYRNQGGLGNQVQVIGTCTFMGSYRQAAGAPDENAVGFEDPNNATNRSFRLTAAAPVGTIREAVACGDIGFDFEGDARPQPAGGMCDFGADEYRVGQ